MADRKQINISPSEAVWQRLSSRASLYGSSVSAEASLALDAALGDDSAQLRAAAEILARALEVIPRRAAEALAAAASDARRDGK